MPVSNYIVEFLGTFILCFAILQSGKFDTVQPFVIAGALLTAIVLFGAISGGHYNPAVTAMMFAKGDQAVSKPVDALGYVSAQVLGALVAYKAHSML